MDKIEFTTAERETLHYWRFPHPHPRVQLKMEVLYLKSQGLAPADIRRLCVISKPTFYRYLHEYGEGGIEKLQEVPLPRQRSQLADYRASIGPMALKLRSDLIESMETRSYFSSSVWNWQFMAKTMKNRSGRASERANASGSVRSGKFPLCCPYGDNALLRNEIKQMASYRSYSVTGPSRSLATGEKVNG